jgi:hypothetical protein
LEHRHWVENVFGLAPFRIEEIRTAAGGGPKKASAAAEYGGATAARKTDRDSS